MRPIAEASARITGQSFSRKYIALGRVLNCWQEIIGPELAAKAVPQRLIYRKKGKQTPSAILEIASAPADSTVLHYQKDLMLARINQIFGSQWITDLKFVAIDASSPSRSIRVKKTLTDEQKRQLSRDLEGVEDEGMRSLLLSIGEGVFSRGA